MESWSRGPLRKSKPPFVAEHVDTSFVLLEQDIFVEVFFSPHDRCYYSAHGLPSRLPSVTEDMVRKEPPQKPSPEASFDWLASHEPWVVYRESTADLTLTLHDFLYRSGLLQRRWERALEQWIAERSRSYRYQIGNFKGTWTIMIHRDATPHEPNTHRPSG